MIVPPPPPPPPADPAGISSQRIISIEEAEAELAAAGVREQELELELEKLYSRAAHLCLSESRSLTHANERHKQVPAAIRKLQETLQQTSGVADELSSRVRKLDVVCSRVSEALRLVDDMLELRECSDQVMKAIQNEDFEQAARYVARFRASQDNLPPGTDDASVRVLREAEVQLSATVRKRFDVAMAANDSAAVSRFAKLFHPLGLAGEGVLKYSQFIRKTLADKCGDAFRQLGSSMSKNNTEARNGVYEEALMSVFGGIADIVQEHQEAVEREFGPENFIIVIRGLLEEADIQGLKVLEKFRKDNAKVFDGHGKYLDQPSCDMMLVGFVLQETAALTQRTQQFNAYIERMGGDVVEMITDKDAFKANLPKEHSPVTGLPDITKLLHRVQELVSTYVALEMKFMIKSVEKAIHETDSLDATSLADEAKTTTMVDDAFFVMRESMLRAVETYDINAVCATVNNVNGCISNEVKNALVMNLQESARLYRAWMSNAKNLQLPEDETVHPLLPLFIDPDAPKTQHDPDGKLRSPLTAQYSWPHSLNNLQQSIEYMNILKSTIEAQFDETFPEEGVDKDKRVMFQHCVANLDGTKGELENLHAQRCKEGLTMVKDTLSTAIGRFKDIDYEIDETKYQDYQVNDPFAKNFNAAAEVLHQHLKAVLNPISCEEIVQNMAEQTCRRIENVAVQKRFSLFGALQFDTDVRSLCSFFTGVSDQALRHKFARLFDMSFILNLESASELREFHGDLRSWRLTTEEIRKLIHARVDFDATEADLEGFLQST